MRLLLCTIYGIVRSLSSTVMATERIERTTGDTGAATTVGGEVGEERTAVSHKGTAAAGTNDSLSLSACTSSLSNSDSTLKVSS